MKISNAAFFFLSFVCLYSRIGLDRIGSTQLELSRMQLAIVVAVAVVDNDRVVVKPLDLNG